MRELFRPEGFTGFGPDRFAPNPNPTVRVCAGDLEALRAAVRSACPPRPGVYGMVDARGELIYVGKAKRLRARVLSYFRAGAEDDKARRILARTAAVAWEPAPSEFAALLRELDLIRRWRPRFNVQGQPQRQRRVYVCLGRAPAPYAFLSRTPAATARAVFGPVPAGPLARAAVRRLNDWFKLRDCPRAHVMAFADQGELFPDPRGAGCLRYEIGTCLGPCAGACTRAAYREQVHAAQAFLRGSGAAVLDALRGDMASASAQQAYERAAVLRDTLAALEWLHGELHALRDAQERYSFIYPVGDGEDERWYLIHRGRVVAAVRPTRHTARLVERIYDRQLPAAEPIAPDAVHELLLVAGWFRRHPDELGRVLAPADVVMRLSRTADSPPTGEPFHVR